MNTIVLYTLASLILFTSAAPEGNPSPVYKPPETGFVADQPVYAPDTPVPTTSSNSVPAVAASSNVGVAVDNTNLYNPQGYVDGGYNGYSVYDPGYGLQTGYEGYLVPSGYYSQLIPAEAGTLSYLWSLLPPSAITALAIVGKGLAYAAAAAAVVLIGAAAVFGLCTFTPLCHIKINGINPLTIKEEVRAYMTPDNLSNALRFVRQAIEKYQKMQKTK